LTTAPPPPAPAPARRARPFARWLVPSLFDFFFLSVPGWLFLLGAGFQRLLLDGDTGWHIRLGQWILEHRQVPATDIFSFTMPGEPWFAWEWLAGVIYALLMEAFGLKGVVWWSGVLVALSAGVLFRLLLWRGANVFIALPLLLAAVSVATLHLLARPHLYTQLLLPVVLWVLYRDLRRPSPWLWTLIPLTILWTNLHGGWLGGVATMGVLAAGLAAEAALGARSWQAPRRFAALTAACMAASVVNPYGWRLHVHLAGFFQNEWIPRHIREFQSPSFRSEAMSFFEVLLFAGILGAGLLLRRRRIAEPLLVLFWAHQSLVSARHAVLYSIVAAPMLAGLAAVYWRAWMRHAPRSSIRAQFAGLARDCQPALRRASLWPAAVLLALLLPAAPVSWPADFPEDGFPVALAREFRGLLTTRRTFTTDDWADYLLYANYPEQRVFFDGRSDFYGPEIGDQYFEILEGRREWRSRLDEHGIEVVLVGPGKPLASLLRQDPAWVLKRETGLAVLFARAVPEKEEARP
jgi:hypothetical protein